MKRDKKHTQEHKAGHTKTTKTTETTKTYKETFSHTGTIEERQNMQINTKLFIQIHKDSHREIQTYDPSHWHSRREQENTQKSPKLDEQKQKDSHRDHVNGHSVTDADSEEGH